MLKAIIWMARGWRGAGMKHKTTATIAGIALYVWLGFLTAARYDHTHNDGLPPWRGDPGWFFAGVFWPVYWTWRAAYAVTGPDLARGPE